MTEKIIIVGPGAAGSGAFLGPRPLRDAGADGGQGGGEALAPAQPLKTKNPNVLLKCRFSRIPKPEMRELPNCHRIPTLNSYIRDAESLNV